MRKILFLLSIIEFLFASIHCNTVDTLFIFKKGNYQLSYSHIKTINYIKPDSIIRYLNIDSTKGIIKLRRNFADSVVVTINYSSYDEYILLKKHTFDPFLKYIQPADSVQAYKNNYKKSKRNENFASGLNILNFNMNDHNGFNINTAADNHFNYHSPGGIIVNGYINDNNKIFSGEGAYLSDISGMNIFLGKDKNSINLGDISYKLNGLKQKMIGVDLKYGNKLRLLAGLDGGERGNVEITIKENYLGPYNILSSNDSLYYISPQSEKVFLNGNILRSGIDYSIDYTYGTIEILPSIKINEGDKLYITYQLKSRYNLRHYMHIAGSINRHFTVMYDETRDWNRNIFGISYDSIICYNDSTIILNGSKFVGANKGDYIKSGEHFIYAGYNQGNYICHFTYVGDSTGDYIYDNAIHGFSYVGEHKGDYLPVIIVHPPGLKRSISLKGDYSGLNASITLLQDKSNLLVGDNNYNSTGVISYRKIFGTETDITTILPSFKWFQNIKYNDFSDKIALLKSDFNLIKPDSFKNVFLSDLHLNYKYKDKLSLKSYSSELLNKNIFKTNTNLILNINKYIYTSYYADYLSSSPYNYGQFRGIYTLGVKNRYIGIEMFHKDTNTDTLRTFENGISISRSILSLSLYKKFYAEYSSMNYEISLSNKNSMLHAYIETHKDTITSQFDIQFSKNFKLFNISIKGNGGNYKPYFLISQFIESSNGNYDYDSLNNIYYSSDNGHFIRKLIYKQYELPLNNYNFDLKIHSAKFLIFNGTISLMRNYIQNLDTIQRNDRLRFNGIIKKNFKNNSFNLKSDLIRSNLITSEYLSGEFIIRKDRAELYTISFNYNYCFDGTPYLQSSKKYFGGYFGYGINLFNIKFVGGYITYTIPEKQNIFHYGTEIIFPLFIMDYHFTFTPVLNYNLYGNDNRFGEIDENYPKGFDAILKLNVQHSLNNNTELNFNADVRYNGIKGFFKTFNLSVGVSL